MVSLILFDCEGEPVCIQEEFIIADVVNPLLAVGKLIRAGWEVKTEQGTILTDGESMIPVHFHKNSLVTYAFIPELQQEHMNGNMVKYSSRQSVRTVIQLNSFVKKCLEDGVGWHNAQGIPGIVHFCMKQMSYLDPSPMFSGMYFPYRTTVIKDGDTWKAIEVSKKYLDRREPFEAFENEVDELITFVSPKPVTLSVIGFPVEQSERAECENQTQDYWSMNGLELTRHHVSPRVHKFLPEGVRGFPTSLRNLNSTRKTMGEAYFGKEVFVVRDEWMDEDPYQEPFSQAWTGKTVFTMIEKEGGELQVQEPPKKKKPTIPLEPVPEDEEMVDPQEGIIPEQLVVEHEGYIYDENCTLHDLRALCKNFGVRTFGSKKQILKRLSSHMQSEDRKQKVEEMSKKYEDAKESPFRLQEQKGNVDSSKPTVSFDFCFTATATSEEPPATCLVVVDDWTKAVLAVPVSAKGGPIMMKHMKEAVVQFCSQLGYTNMNFRGDNESAAKSLKDSVQKARGVMGLGTILQDTKSYIHQSNGLAERTVQTTRRQANTFLDALREKTKLGIPHTHPIFGWAFRHAAWVLNRFSKIASLGNRTPHELVTGKPYKGEMVNFGAVIYVKRLHPKKKKGEKVWNPGIFLGKTENDLFITHHADGIHTSRSARAVGEPCSSEKVAAVDYFPWEVRTSTLTSRVIPQKKLPQPQASLALPAVPQGEGLQQEAIENQEHEEDELSTDEEVQGKEMVVEPEPVPVPEVTDATMLHELLPQESEQRQQEDVEVSSPRTSGAISSSSRPQFEVVGSPSKIP